MKRESFFKVVFMTIAVVGILSLTSCRNSNNGNLTFTVKDGVTYVKNADKYPIARYNASTKQTEFLFSTDMVKCLYEGANKQNGKNVVVERLEIIDDQPTNIGHPGNLLIAVSNQDDGTTTTSACMMDKSRDKDGNTIYKFGSKYANTPAK